MFPEEKYIMFKNRLTKVYRHLSKQARRQNISCYRIYDHDLPEFPFCIEAYDQLIYLAEYKRKFEMAEKPHEEWLDRCIEIIAEVLAKSVDSIYIKERKRKAGREDQYQRVGEEEDFIIVEEAGLKFKVNLSDYLDTGLFLDHRITRLMVKDEAKDKNVLNLFCYTASFSVYAAAGGAKEVVSIDLSNTYLNWAKENFELNGFAESNKYRFIKADVLQYLDQLPLNHFDLVILDPPTFSNSKMMKDILDIQQDHVVLINKLLLSVKSEGKIYFSTNSRKFVIDDKNIKAKEIKDITRATTPFDFEGKLNRYCFKILK
jgi:23S rRNA (guanine2069-N7)-methyltransferase